MDDSAKQAGLIVGLILVIGLLTMPLVKRKENSEKFSKKLLRKQMSTPTEGQAQDQASEDAIVCLTAYIKCYNAGEPQSKLDELNSGLDEQYGMIVNCEGSEETGFNMAVVDQEGNNIVSFEPKLS